ncbi:hypothetical protein [Hydrogenophaga taeniospiralis]|uniref:hypothetical protein n=1 Tax=Hydrogenophaga taeniospiralis TaxID=65656 RepID=UPI0039AFDCA3
MSGVEHVLYGCARDNTAPVAPSTDAQAEPNPQQLFLTLQARANRLLAEQPTQQEYEDCLERIRIVNSQLEESRLLEESRRIGDGSRRANRSEFPRLFGALLNPDLCLQRDDLDIEMHGLATATSPQGMLAYVTDLNASELQQKLGLSGSNMPLRKMLELLSLTWDASPAYSRIDEKSLKLLEARDRAQAHFKELSSTTSSSVSTWIREFYWAYILISAFGLKIARRNYLNIRS